MFKEDYFWMLRELKGYFSWLTYNKSNDLYKYLYLNCQFCNNIDYRNIIKYILNNNVCDNELIDIFYKALIRSEIRFISHFIPQRSHEERLTGNIISEIDNAIFISKQDIHASSINLYSEIKELDFVYLDLSKGGRLEKYSGADLGFLIIMDLPDYPKTIKSIIIQVKKVDNSAKINKKQFETLHKQGSNKSAYLFYDMKIPTLSVPLVLTLENDNLRNKYEESIKNNTESFTLKFDEVCQGIPLSLFLITFLNNNKLGNKYNSLNEGIEYFNNLYMINDDGDSVLFNGRLGVISIGNKIQNMINLDKEFTIDI